MSSLRSQIAQPSWSTCYGRNRLAVTSMVFCVAACCGSLLAQTAAQVSLTGPPKVRFGGTAQYSALVSGATGTAVVWSVNGVAHGTAATGTISASGLYSPASTILAGHSVTIGAATASKPASSASLSVKVLNPLPILRRWLRHANSAGRQLFAGYTWLWLRLRLAVAGLGRQCCHHLPLFH